MVFNVGIEFITSVRPQSTLICKYHLHGWYLQCLDCWTETLCFQSVAVSFLAEEELGAVSHLEQMAMGIIGVPCRGEECLSCPLR